MPRYIDAEKALRLLQQERIVYRGDTFWGLSVAEIVIGEMPTEDVAPVVHAHWVGFEYVDDIFECSNCGMTHYGEEDTLTPYCPHCGAKMDEETDHAD